MLEGLKRGGLGEKDKKFSCRHIELELTNHPGKNVIRVIGDVELDRERSGAHLWCGANTGANQQQENLQVSFRIAVLLICDCSIITRVCWRGKEISLVLGWHISG